MADLSITAASVAASLQGDVSTRLAGAAITAGQTVYFDTSTNTYKLADSNSATAAVRQPAGIALNSAASGQPVTVKGAGPITFNAVLTLGVGYYQSATPGGICPAADLTTGHYPTFLGFATSTTVLDLDIQQAGVALG